MMSTYKKGGTLRTISSRLALAKVAAARYWPLWELRLRNSRGEMALIISSNITRKVLQLLIIKVRAVTVPKEWWHKRRRRLSWPASVTIFIRRNELLLRQHRLLPMLTPLLRLRSSKVLVTRRGDLLWSFVIKELIQITSRLRATEITILYATKKSPTRHK